MLISRKTLLGRSDYYLKGVDYKLLMAQLHVEIRLEYLLIWDSLSLDRFLSEY